MSIMLPASTPNDTTPRREATSLYRFYDAMGVLIYIGITKRGAARADEHNLKDWWPFVASQTVQHFETRVEAAYREKKLIQKYRPPFNTQHNPGWEQVRAAYLNFTQTAVADPAKLWRSLGKRMPLAYLASADRKHTFRTLPEHASLARLLTLEQPKKLGSWGYQCNAVLQEIVINGPCAMLQITSDFIPNGSEDVSMNVVPTDGKLKAFVVRGVTLQFEKAPPTATQKAYDAWNLRRASRTTLWRSNEFIAEQIVREDL